MDSYLGLQLHHVSFYFQVGFIQFFDFMIQVLHVIVVVDSCLKIGNTRMKIKLNLLLQ